MKKLITCAAMAISTACAVPVQNRSMDVVEPPRLVDAATKRQTIPFDTWSISLPKDWVVTTPYDDRVPMIATSPNDVGRVPVRINVVTLPGLLPEEELKFIAVSKLCIEKVNEGLRVMSYRIVEVQGNDGGLLVMVSRSGFVQSSFSTARNGTGYVVQCSGDGVEQAARVNTLCREAMLSFKIER